MTDVLDLTAAIAKLSWAARLRAAGSVLDAAAIGRGDLCLLDIEGGFVVDVTHDGAATGREFSVEEIVAALATPVSNRAE